MKLLKQIGIVLAISLLGNILSQILKIPIPGTVMGMILLFIALSFNIIKEEQIDEFSELLLLNIAFLLIPPGVGLLRSIDSIAKSWVKILIVVIVSTIITMGVTGLVVQFMIKKLEGKK